MTILDKKVSKLNQLEKTVDEQIGVSNMD